MLRIDPNCCTTTYCYSILFPSACMAGPPGSAAQTKNINAHEVIEEGILHKKLRHILKTGAQY